MIAIVAWNRGEAVDVLAGRGEGYTAIPNATLAFMMALLVRAQPHVPKDLAEEIRDVLKGTS